VAKQAHNEVMAMTARHNEAATRIAREHGKSGKTGHGHNEHELATSS